MSDVPDRLLRPTEVEPSDGPAASSLTSLIVGVTVIVALYLGQEVLVPITLAVLLSFLLAPLVNRLRRNHVGRLPAVLMAVVLALGIVLTLGGVIGAQFADLARDIPRYQTTIVRKIEAIRGLTFGRLSELINRVGHEIERTGAPAQPPGADEREGRHRSPEPTPLPVELRQPAVPPFELAWRIIAPALHPLATTGITFIVAIFILLQQDDLRDRLIRLFGSGDLHRTTLAMDDAARRLSRFFLIQLGINAGFGIIVGAGLTVIGLPNPPLWATLAMLMRFVPYIGSYVAAGFPLLVAAAVDPGWSMVAATAALFVVGEIIMGQLVEPMVYGRSTGLSPIAVILAAIFWGWLWGPIGVILSTPLTLCLVVLGRHVERLEFLDVLLGDRPALSPVESFYQRALAGDTDEVQDQAEHLLEKRSLSSYYDEVVVPGLRLAANDVIRGVLTRPQLDRIHKTVRDLVGELDAYRDIEPAAADAEGEPAQGVSDEPAAATDELATQIPHEAPILCIAGRGPLDELVALMLTQLLSKHGLNARMVPYQAVSRAGIGTFGAQGVRTLCASHLEISETPPHVRYLLRRLRQRLPAAHILVGLWQAGHQIINDPSLRSRIGADVYFASMREAVSACVSAEETGTAAAKDSEAPAA
ncbi:MAG: AI-2E family transporter [Xanthobacteraceae bacterium]